MTYEMLLENAFRIDAEAENKENVFLTDAKIIAFALDHCEITVPEESTYFVKTNAAQDERILRHLITKRVRQHIVPTTPQELRDGRSHFAIYGSCDFGHTAPVWNNIMRLGLQGLKQRVMDRTGAAKNPDFVEGEMLVFDAAQRFMCRAAEEAQKAGKTAMAEGIRNLTHNPPSNLFECYQMTLVFYTLQQFFDGTDIRTMGRLDQLALPFYEKEQDVQYVKELTRLYMLEIDAIKASANLPFAIAGTDGSGNSQVNAMSYILLDAYAETKLPNTKLHILCNPDMPRDFLRTCMQCVKSGGNSLVFINNQLMVDGLVKLGISREDAAGYAIVGCYEASAQEEVPCSCASRMSLPKALEVTLHGGRDGMSELMLGHAVPTDFDSFDALYTAFLANVKRFAEQSMAMTDHYEKYYPMVHASPFFSACLSSCVENGGDAYADFAARYNNTSVNAIGLGTAVDSLYAIRKLVYEDRRLSLQQFVEILDNNWEGQEILRRIIRNKLPKFGMANPEVDALAQDIVKHLSDFINNQPNAKGGVYRLGLFSINWRSDWGVHTAASADGRRKGETLSQNTSCTFGMDKEGPTGHILSVASLDGVDAVNGSVLDIDLHSSAVRGENGTNVLMATLDTFMQAGGQTVHYNVLDTDTLRDAQEHPEQYPNLQVRMCGWNVLFTHLSRKSQDEFIHRSEMQAG